MQWGGNDVSGTRVWSPDRGQVFALHGLKRFLLLLFLSFIFLPLSSKKRRVSLIRSSISKEEMRKTKLSRTGLRTLLHKYLVRAIYQVRQKTPISQEKWTTFYTANHSPCHLLCSLPCQSRSSPLRVPTTALSLHFKKTRPPPANSCMFCVSSWSQRNPPFVREIVIWSSRLSPYRTWMTTSAMT